MNQPTTGTGATPLYIACQEGHAEIITLLLAHHRIDVNQARTDVGATPLFIACQRGHVEIITLLLAHDEIDANQARTDTGETPLYTACHEGHAEIITLLLAHHRIDVNQARTDAGMTPLYAACQQGHAEIVKLLLVHDGIDADQARKDSGSTPLHMACGKGHVDIIKLLLRHCGINANQARTDNGTTPLHAAVFGGVLLAMQYLVVHRANLVAESINGETPVQLAAFKNKPELVEWLNAVSGWSQLRVAAGCRLYKDAAFLLRRGKIDPDDPATTSVKDIMAAIAAANAKPASLPWHDAPQTCRATSKLVADATRGWHRTTHWLHHKAVRDAVFAVLVVAWRLQQKAEASSDARAPVDADTADESAQEPLLPIEIWLFAMRFFKRSWWVVGG